MPSRTLILGASSAIGQEIIRAIDAPDRLVVAHYRSGRVTLDALAGSITGRLVPLQADLARQEGCEALLRAADRYCDVPDGIVILPAPKVTMVRFKDLEWAQIQECLDLQLGASFRVLRHYLPRMARRKSGKVVFVLSSYTLGVPPTALVHYTTAKYAQLGLMKSLAAEYARKRLCINAVSPSMVETEFLSAIPKTLVDFTAQRHPLGRNARPGDVAPAVAFLLSDHANYINGVNLPIAGGLVF
jgi:3-oxoacyl-[acyl-carrier protein] reductase